MVSFVPSLSIAIHKSTLPNVVKVMAVIGCSSCRNLASKSYVHVARKLTAQARNVSPEINIPFLTLNHPIAWHPMSSCDRDKSST